MPPGGANGFEVPPPPLLRFRPAHEHRSSSYHFCSGIVFLSLLVTSLNRLDPGLFAQGRYASLVGKGKGFFDQEILSNLMLSLKLHEELFEYRSAASCSSRPLNSAEALVALIEDGIHVLQEHVAEDVESHASA